MQEFLREFASSAKTLASNVKTLKSNVKAMSALLDRAKSIFQDEKTRQHMSDIVQNIVSQKYTKSNFEDERTTQQMSDILQNILSQKCTKAGDDPVESHSGFTQDEDLFNDPAFQAELDQLVAQAMKKNSSKKDGNAQKEDHLHQGAPKYVQAPFLLTQEPHSEERHPMYTVEHPITRTPSPTNPPTDLENDDPKRIIQNVMFKMREVNEISSDDEEHKEEEVVYKRYTYCIPFKYNMHSI